MPVSVSRSSPAAPSSARAMPKSATSVLAVGGEQDVLGLDVAVDDAVLVGVVERAGRLARRCGAASSTGSWRSRRSRSRSDSPSTNGMVNQSWPAASPESWTVRMWGCWSRAAKRISRWKRSGPSVAASSGRSTLSATGPVVPEVVREVDGGHAAAAELALEGVAVGEGVAQAVRHSHGGLPRSRESLS